MCVITMHVTMTSFSLKQSKLLAGTEFAEIATDCSSTHYQEELNRWKRDFEVLHSSCTTIVRGILTKALWFFFFLEGNSNDLCFVRGKWVSCKMPAFSKIPNGKHSFSHVPTHLLFYGEEPQYTSSERSGSCCATKNRLVDVKMMGLALKTVSMLRKK